MARIDAAIKAHDDPPAQHRAFATSIFPDKDEQIAVIRAHEYRRGAKLPVAFDVVSRIIQWAEKHARNKPSRRRDKAKK